MKIYTAIALFTAGFISSYLTTEWFFCKVNKSKNCKCNSNKEKEDEEEEEEQINIGKDSENTYIYKGEVKMVFVIRKDLKMTKGKVASQVAHAAVGLLKMAQKNTPILLKSWERNGQPKITLNVNDQAGLEELYYLAKCKQLPALIIHDAGRTQIASGSSTVLGIGPAFKSEIDQVTGHLSLY